jgi:transcription termination factor NusB
MEQKKSKEKQSGLLKSTARLIICQALHMFYDPNNEEKDIAKILSIIDEYYVSYVVKDYYISNNIKDDIDKSKYKKLYNNKFTLSVVDRVIQNADRLDAEIKKYLTKEEPLETLDLMLIQIVRSALAESELFPNLNRNIIIDEYVSIASEFYNNIYVSFTNGVLTNIFNKNSGEKEEINIGNKRKILSLKK